MSAVDHFSAEYAIYALVAQPGSLPAGEGLAWLTSWVWILYIGCIALSLLLFPNGRLPSSGWRWAGMAHCARDDSGSALGGALSWGNR